MTRTYFDWAASRNGAEVITLDVIDAPELVYPAVEVREEHFDSPSGLWRRINELTGRMPPERG